jgi:hypothetical protein
MPQTASYLTHITLNYHILGNKSMNHPSTSNISLVGGVIAILKNDGVRQWGWDDIP